jgi:hypothetical protein
MLPTGDLLERLSGLHEVEVRAILDGDSARATQMVRAPAHAVVVPTPGARHVLRVYSDRRISI